MTGNNKIEVNQSTMIQIVQKWADEEFKSKPTIKSIKSLDKNMGSFSIVTEQKPDKKEEAEAKI